MTYVMAIHTQGLDNEIRCAMCTNSMKSDRGCDGGCIVDNEMYKRVMNTINNHIFKQEPCDDAISRQEVLNNAYAYGNGLEPDGYCVNVEDIQALPPVTPQPRSEVLDKIRAEIIKLQTYKMFEGEDTIYVERDDVLEILDKYRTESEE